MPTYEYRCKSCGEHLEVVQSFSDDALTECPACQGPLRKVFGNIGITFKGSGFYKTDSRATGKGGSRSDSSSSDSSSAPSSTGSSSDGSSTGSTSGAGSSSESSGSSSPAKSPPSDSGKAAVAS